MKTKKLTIALLFTAIIGVAYADEPQSTIFLIRENIQGKQITHVVCPNNTGKKRCQDSRFPTAGWQLRVNGTIMPAITVANGDSTVNFDGADLKDDESVFIHDETVGLASDIDAVSTFRLYVNNNEIASTEATSPTSQTKTHELGDGREFPVLYLYEKKGDDFCERGKLHKVDATQDNYVVLNQGGCYGRISQLWKAQCVGISQLWKAQCVGRLVNRDNDFDQKKDNGATLKCWTASMHGSDLSFGDYWLVTVRSHANPEKVLFTELALDNKTPIKIPAYKMEAGKKYSIEAMVITEEKKLSSEFGDVVVGTAISTKLVQIETDPTKVNKKEL